MAIVVGSLVFFFSWFGSAADTVDVVADDYGPLPKYEVGFAVGTFYLPDYPGSDEMRGIFIPLPFVIYRGPVLKADREEGVRTRFFKTFDFEMDLSFGAAFPSDGEENKSRDGMDDLDWIGEVGPRAKWFLHRNQVAQLEFLLPIRYVFSVDFPDSRHQGFVFNPELVFRHKAFFMKDSRIVASLGFTHATKRLMEYFYTVEPDEALPTRPAYEAEAGYFGTNMAAVLVRSFRKQRIQIFTGLSMNIYDNAKNVDSPLLNDRYTLSYFLGLSMGLWESEEQGVVD